MVDYDVDVLVLGGGPAGMWAAVAAASDGARVALVDKGLCGSTGPAAYGKTRLCDIAPGVARDRAIDHWSHTGGYLGDPDRMCQVMNEAHRRLEQLEQWGCLAAESDRIASDARLVTLSERLPGVLRRRLVALGVRVLDHHPALQLLTDAAGAVSGACGIAGPEDGQRWQIRAGAVVVATGGCAFKTGSAGTDGNTGDGHLMSAEVGAELSGMEFSAGYGLAAAGERVVNDAILPVATLCDDTGVLLAEPGSDDARLEPVFAAIADGRRVNARLTGAPAVVTERVRRTGIDPSGPIALHPVHEGTVRGTGGLRVTSTDCGTTVPGLYAAGDATSRESVVGAASGIGGRSIGWAMASGAWAGAAAERFAGSRGVIGRVRVATRPGMAAGCNPFGRINPYAVIGLIQEHTVPLRRNYWRNQAVLRDSVTELDGLWPGAVYGLGGSGNRLLVAREAASMLAVARWAVHSALARTESRGLHRRTDHPDGQDRWQVHLAVGGLDEIWVREGIRLPRVPA